MAFPSQHASKIWNKLYTVLIPDQVTLNVGYVKKFGTHVTGNKVVDDMLSKNQTQVMIPVATMLEYFEDGIEIQIPSRDDMIAMHKDMEAYLAEWRDHIKYDINTDLLQHKVFILSLEKLSKHIYEKAKPRELVDNLFKKQTFGLLNPLAQIAEDKREVHKPDYEGISKLVRTKAAPNKPTGRF
jgi:hypothetical protein